MSVVINVLLQDVLKVLRPSDIIRKRADEKSTYRDFAVISEEFPPTNDSIIYLCSSNYLTEEAEELTRCCLMIRDKGNYDYTRLRCDYVLLSSQVSIQELQSSVKPIFMTHQNLACMELNDALVAKDTLSGLLTLAQQKMGCPMLICSALDRVILHAGTEYADDPSFSSIIESGGCPKDLLQAARKEKVESLLVQVNYPVLIGVGQFRKRKRIFSWIYINGFRCGYLIALEPEIKFTPFDILLVSTISNAISSVVRKQFGAKGRPYLEEYAVQNYLKEILKGTTAKTGIPALLGDPRAGRACMLVIDADRDNPEEKAFFFALHQMADDYPSVICQMDGNCVVLARELPYMTFVDGEKNLRELLKTHGHRAGICMVDPESNDLKKCYVRAKETLAVCSMDTYGDIIAEYKSVRLILLLRDIPSDQLSNYYDPFLDKLLEYDRLKGTAYYKTLYAYIRSSYNRMLTANRLFLHRNTVSYQLNKIEEMLGSPLDDAERGFFLYLSFKINEMRGISPI